jgi:ATPase subunit of ABC transporter with duplicated ATPase domains
MARHAAHVTCQEKDGLPALSIPCPLLFCPAPFLPCRGFPAGLNPTLFSREQDGRDYLGSFGLGGNPSTQPLSSLSGGQKARAALAFLLVTRPQLLLLDEPTNHLDVSTIEALVRAIQQYSGAVVVASHDVRFVKEVVGEGAGGGDEEEDEGSMGEVWVVGEGRVAQWWDGVEAYVQRLHKQVVKQQGGLLKMQQQ